MAQDIIIDASNANADQRAGRIQWDRVYKSGIRHLWHRACYRTEPDASYAQNVRDAREAGLHTRAYAFLRPGSMRDQVDLFLNLVRPQRGDVCIPDFEDYKGGTPTADELELWCETVEAVTGTDVLVYSRKDVIDLHVPAGHPFRARRRKLWLSGYPTPHGAKLPAWDGRPHHLGIPTGWSGSDVLAWQYTDEGVVPGVRSGIDRSIIGDGVTL